MNHRIFSFLKGSIVAFVGVNIIISLLTYTISPDFFHPALLLRPQFLTLTFSFSVVISIGVKYVDRYFDDSETEIREEFDEVTPDLEH